MALRPSSVLPAKRALLALLMSADELADAEVRLGLPAEEPTKATRAYVLTNLPRDYDNLTQQGGKTESYVIPVALEARIFDDEVDTLEETIEALGTVVFDLIEADRELGGACFDATVERIAGPVTQPTTDGWISQVTLEVRVESQL